MRPVSCVFFTIPVVVVLVAALVGSLHLSVAPAEGYVPRASTSCADCVQSLSLGDHGLAERTVELGGVSFRVVHNADFSLDRQTVVFQHGFPDNLYSFTHQMKFLSSKGLNSISPSLRGYDPTHAFTNHTGPAAAQDLAKVLDALGVQGKVHVVGHDWGVVVASEFAVAFPERVRSLSMWSVGPPWRFQEMLTLAQVKLSWYMLFFQLPWLPERWLANCKGVTWLWNAWSPNPFSQERLNSVCHTLSQGNAVSGALAWYRHLPSELARAVKGAIQIDAPTMVLAGADDRVMRPQQSVIDAVKAEDFPAGVETRIIPGAGHFMQHEEPALVNAALWSHISQH